MKLALAPIPYYWPQEAVFAFYDAVRETPVDIVYLGETVCAKRHELRHDDWIDIGNRLHDAGKEVVLSTQVLLESDTHLNTMRRITQNGVFPVEANDMGAVRLLADGSAFVAGLHLNIYNPPALKMLSDMGARRWVMPLEMNRDDLAGMMASCPEGVEVEVFGYGRLPLAFSARCFTARHYNLPKDDCRFHCLAHPDGLVLQTREQQDFLVINGIQTQSDRIYCLFHELPALQQTGVDIVRISPQWKHTPDIIRLYADVLSGSTSPAAAAHQLEEVMPAGPCNGYWYGKPGMEYVRHDIL
ncbi:U32 family peptidase [Oxalobacter sp. OttesenSCG-928-P03]|nr:U32 family peptidase [Oxalobacter sp. OttesenSCG-928-P03]